MIKIPHLESDRTLLMNARHVQPGAWVIVNGRRVNGGVRCRSGVLPSCVGEEIIVELEEIPLEGGMHFLQVQNPEGKFSNDLPFFSDLMPAPPRVGNIIGRGGDFSEGESHWRSVNLNGRVEFINNRVEAKIDRVSESQPWRVQLSHYVRLVKGQEYTLCYRARADQKRNMTAYLDTGASQYQSLSGGQVRVSLTTRFQSFSHTWTAPISDVSSRVAFDFAQSQAKVYLDDVWLFEGGRCGKL